MKRKGNRERKEKKLSLVFRRKLLKVTSIILLISVGLITFLTPMLKNESVLDILSTQLSQVKEEIVFESDSFFGGLIDMVSEA